MSAERALTISKSDFKGGLRIGRRWDGWRNRHKRFRTMNSLINRIDGAYGWFVRSASACQSPVLLAVRLYWGWQFWQSGWGKLQDIPKVVDYFTSLGVPFPAFNAPFIAALEAGGGILLLLGLGSRLIALPLFFDMIVAFVMGDREALRSIISDPDKFYAAA